MHLRSRLILFGSALAAATAISTPALAAPTVTVRVEGESATLLPARQVVLEKPDPLASGCPVNSANAAINDAVEQAGGTWDHGDEEGSTGDFTETILGETHVFETNETTWDVWVNDKWAGGICEDLLAEGDELLVVADHDPQPAYAPTRLPLVISDAPREIEAGAPFTVRVQKVHTRAGTFPEVGEGTLLPEEGVTVAVSGYQALTNSKGEATLTVGTPGSYIYERLTLTASEPGAVPPAAMSLCVRNPGEASCGEGLHRPLGCACAPAEHEHNATLYTGPYALVASLTTVHDGAVYARGKGPRLLAGTIIAHDTVTDVSMELRRSYRGRCYFYSAVRARFVGARCGAGRTFHVGSSASFSYLLPKRLRPGRYVLDVSALDAAGNRTTLARGTSRLVFDVR